MIEIEKFIPPSYANILEDIICKSPEFQWVYTPSTNNQKETAIMKKDADSYDSEQLVHALYLENARRSQYFDLVFPFFYFLEEKTGIRLDAVERIKANMLLKSDMPDDKYNTPHIDVPDADYKSLLYYVKDSDGDTFIFNETFKDKKALTLNKRVSPRKGKAVIFDSNTWHASSNPRQNQNRVVLNLIFRVKT
jgi:2OG-Fe(II) oxygenase superfamily